VNQAAWKVGITVGQEQTSSGTGRNKQEEQHISEGKQY
jgi:hypothetical protein